MRNLKHILAATAALLSLNTFAGLLQPIVPMNDETSFRITAGANSTVEKKGGEIGASSLGGGLGFTQNVGNDFNWGLAAAMGYANYKGLLFKEAQKDKNGIRTDVELMMSYMPELAENVRAGLILNAGWGDQLTNADAIRKARDFGDLNVKVGIGLSAAFSSVVSAYLAVQASFHNFRINPSEDIKKYSNLWGADVPFGLWFGAGDKVGVFIEANSRFFNISKGFNYFKEELSLGVSYAI